MVKNNMKENTFDLIVIGAGSGGLNIASFMNRVGLRVLLIDKSGAHIGGDCLNFGCVPSKALIHVARTVNESKKASAFGVGTSGSADWSKVRAYIKEKKEIIREHENAAWFRSKGMTVALGSASFVSKNQVTVDGVVYTGKKIVLATGSRPRILSGQGIENVACVLNNENIFTMDSLPTRIMFLGAGPIGIELAQALSYLGSQVTVVDPGEQILGKENREMADVVQRQMEKEGIVFKLGFALKKFTAAGEAVIESKNDGEKNITFDAVFVGIGRVLNTEGLSLEKAGINVDEKGKVIVDSYLRTTNKNVLTCGDIAGNFQFTHAAEMHASVILKNFFSPFKKKFSGDNISWTTYTTPEVAAFGLGEAELTKRSVAYTVLASDFSEDDRAITDEYQYGKSKLFITKKGKILGGTMVAPNAGELISELVLAQKSGLGVDALFNKTYAYPSATRINKRIVSGFFVAKLTMSAKSVLRFLYRFI
jgi:pyruvate/2-oxoglutarate dehydrogenase complex dihydrolipoamide dehydrogenase (E3) component